MGGNAALVDTETDAIEMVIEPYRPDSGGIHPREAAEHVHEHLLRGLGDLLEMMAASPEAVAFSREPVSGRISGSWIRRRAPGERWIGKNNGIGLPEYSPRATNVRNTEPVTTVRTARSGVPTRN